MTSAHSPMPWSIQNKAAGDGERDDVLIDVSGRTVALIGDFLADVHDPIGPSRRRANVALLRAAPDVLAALKALREAFTNEPDSCLDCDRGEGATGHDADGHACALCNPWREALAAADLAIANAEGGV